MSLLFIIGGFIFLFAVRGRWILWKVESYQLKVMWFCWRTKQSPETLREMLDLWPVNHMLFELWNWRFSRYVVHHDHLQRMDVFIEQELQRTDLSADVFSQEKDNNPDLLPPRKK